jgi:hypothetical protein
VTEPDDGVTERWVYFVQAGEDGPIKVGWTANPPRRFAVLQSNHYEELRILGTYRGSRADEALLHLELAEHRIRGEWFRPTPEVLAVVTRCTGDVDEWDSVDEWERRAVAALLVMRTQRSEADKVPTGESEMDAGDDGRGPRGDWGSNP